MIASAPPPCVSGARRPRDHAADERADGRQEQQIKRMERRPVERGQHLFARRPQRRVPGEILQHHALHEIERRDERRAHQAGRRTDQRCVAQHSPGQLQRERRLANVQEPGQLRDRTKRGSTSTESRLHHGGVRREPSANRRVPPLRRVSAASRAQLTEKIACRLTKGDRDL